MSRGHRHKEQKQRSVIEIAFIWMVRSGLILVIAVFLSIVVNIFLPDRIPVTLISTIAGIAGAIFAGVTTIINKYGSVLGKKSDKNGGKDK